MRDKFIRTLLLFHFTEKRTACCYSRVGHEKCFCFTATSWAISNSVEFLFLIFIIVALQGRDATPYLERNRVGRDAIDSAAALTDMGKYLFRERRLPVYDIAVAITK